MRTRLTLRRVVFYGETWPSCAGLTGWISTPLGGVTCAIVDRFVFPEV